MGAGSSCMGGRSSPIPGRRMMSINLKREPSVREDNRRRKPNQVSTVGIAYVSADPRLTPQEIRLVTQICGV
jgi:hypothetical protein